LVRAQVRVSVQVSVLALGRVRVSGSVRAAPQWPVPVLSPLHQARQAEQ
jgi:hypothetical protein